MGLSRPTKPVKTTNTLDTVYLTSHEIARLLGVSASAVLSWIDKGWLNAHRTPGGHRRVGKVVLLKFPHPDRLPLSVGLARVRALAHNDHDPVELLTNPSEPQNPAHQLSVHTAAAPIH